MRFLPLNGRLRPSVATPSSIAALIAAMLMFAGLAGCGQSASSDGGVLPDTAFRPRYEPPPDAGYGGELRVLATGDVDSLDPGSMQNQFSGQVSFATQRTLVAATPGPGPGLRPDIASALPEVDVPGGTVEFRLRQNVSYSPPVSRPVTAADFKYALERGLMPGVANGYLKVFLGNLRGLKAAARSAEVDPSRAPEIEGIEATGADRLRLRFDGPVPPLAVKALTMPFAAPVPREYAARFDRQVPSSYSQHVVATGPYMVENEPDGDLSGYQPGAVIKLVRNPAWKADTDFRPTFLDRITVEAGYANTGPAAEQILTGKSSINGDFSPSPQILKQAASRSPGQLTLIPSGAVLYAALNTTIAPLDDANVRRAILAATDRRAIRLARGGEFAGELATHFLPPDVPGFEQAGGVVGPGFDFLSYPEGSARVAARYMRRAGYANGRYTGDAELSMVTDTTPLGRRTGEVVRQAFESLGIKVRTRAVARDIMYSRFCNVPAAEVAICPNVGWVEQLSDPQTVLEQTFSGSAIQEVNNSNWSQLDVPAINRAIRRAKRITDRDRRAAAWGKIDRMVTGQAPAIPLLWAKLASISSANVINVIDAATASSALPMMALKDPGPGQ